MLTSASCPECGQSFDASNRHTFIHSMVQWRIRRAVRITAWIIAACFAVVTMCISHLERGFTAEQQTLAALNLQGWDGPTAGPVHVDALLSDKAPAWIQRMPLMWRVVFLNIPDDRVSDEDLHAIGKLAHLKSLIIGNAHGITSRGLIGLKYLDLEWLDISNIHLDCQGFVFLEKMHSLRTLDIRFSQVCPDSLHSLLTLPNLEYVSLIDATIDDAGVSILSRHPNLKIVNLNGNPITDASIPALSNGFPNAQEIHLADTNLSDAAMQTLIIKRGLTIISR